MSNIQTYIDEIQNAIYGEEVRSAIINALNQCYTDATEGMRPEISISTITHGHKVTITVGNQSQNFDVMNGPSVELRAIAVDSAVQNFAAGEFKQVWITNIFNNENYPSGFEFLCVVRTWSTSPVGSIVFSQTTAQSINSDDNGRIGLWCANYSQNAQENVTLHALILFWSPVLTLEESEEINP